jgi:hypothetical protein
MQIARMSSGRANFTSRANSKAQARDGQASLHAANKLYSLKVLDVQAT